MYTCIVYVYVCGWMLESGSFYDPITLINVHSSSHRPRNASEKKANSASVVDCNSKTGEVHVKGDKMLSKTFTFDKVFGKNSTQVDVYKEVVNPIIYEVLQGYNCTVFA